MGLVKIISKFKWQPAVPDFDTFLIVFSGESNSGGFAVNADATAPELAARPSVQILNNTSFVFQNLQVGVNNLIDHAGLPANATHGWEIGLANGVDDGDFGPSYSQLYLVKTGQGGSTISQWNVGGTYMNKFTQRINSAKTILDTAGTTYYPIIWYTQGINDAIAGTNINTWKSATISHFADMRALLGSNTPILMTTLMTPTYNSYNTAINEIAASTSNVYVVDTTGATLRDSNHWDYAGMKLIAGRMIEQTLNTL